MEQDLTLPSKNFYPCYCSDRMSDATNYDTPARYREPQVKVYSIFNILLLSNVNRNLFCCCQVTKRYSNVCPGGSAVES